MVDKGEQWHRKSQQQHLDWMRLGLEVWGPQTS